MFKTSTATFSKRLFVVLFAALLISTLGLVKTATASTVSDSAQLPYGVGIEGPKQASSADSGSDSLSKNIENVMAQYAETTGDDQQYSFVSAKPFHYYHRSPFKVAGNMPAVYNLIDAKTGNVLHVYCADEGISAKGDKWYKRVSFEDSDYQQYAGTNGENARLLAAIIENSYPNISVQDFVADVNAWLSSQGKPELSNVDYGQVVSATQAAIWQTIHTDKASSLVYTGSFSTDTSSRTTGPKKSNPDTKVEYPLTDTYIYSNHGAAGENIKSMISYLTSLPGVSYDTDIDINVDGSIGYVDITSDTPQVHLSVNLPKISGVDTYAYKIDRKVGSSLTKISSGNVSANSGKIEVVDNLSGVSADAEAIDYVVTVNANRNIKDQVYIYMSKDGRSDAQTYVGIESGTIAISGKASFELDNLETKSVTVHKVGLDKSGNRESLAGAEFELHIKMASGDDFKVASGTTDASGNLTFSGLIDPLPSGAKYYYLKEVKAPEGYIATTDDNIQISTSDLDGIIEVENERAVGSLTVYKNVIGNAVSSEALAAKNNLFYFNLQGPIDGEEAINETFSVEVEEQLLGGLESWGDTFENLPYGTYRLTELYTTVPGLDLSVSAVDESWDDMDVLWDESGNPYVEVVVGPEASELEVRFENDYNFDIEPASILLKKYVENIPSGGNEAPGFTGYHFVVTLSDSSINGQYGDMYFIDGVANVVLKHNQTAYATNLPAGINYSIVEIEANFETEVNGFPYTGPYTGTISSDEGSFVEFVNYWGSALADLGKITVNKSVIGAEPASLEKTYTFQIHDSQGRLVQVDTAPDGSPVTELKLSSANGWTATTQGLVPDTYKVYEIENDIDIAGYTVSVEGNGAVANVDMDTDATVTVTNTYNEIPAPETCDINVNKVWKDAFGQDIAAPEGARVVVNLLQNDAVCDTVELSGDKWSHTFSGLLKYDESGAEFVYSVEEVAYEGFETSVFGNASDGFVITNTQVPESLHFGSLTLTKTVSGLVDDGCQYGFTIVGNGGFSESVTLSNGQTATFNNLVPGSYTIVEDKDTAAVDGYTLDVEGEGEVVVLPDYTTQVEVTNSYTPIPEDEPTPVFGSLLITKTIVAPEGVATDKDFIFDVVSDNGYTNTVVIHGAGVSHLENLEPGNYTVTERDASIDGFIWTVSGTDTVSVSAGNEAYVGIVNNYSEVVTTPGSLTISKAIMGGGEAAASENYTFDVYGPEGFHTEVSIHGANSTTLSNLSAGTYTVVEKSAEIDGYTWTPTEPQSVDLVLDPETGTVSSGTLTFINEYAPVPEIPDNPEPEYCSLTLHKVIQGSDSDALNRTYTFTVTGPDGFNKSVDILGASSVTFNNLVPGTYTITEAYAGSDGFIWSVFGTGTVKVSANTLVERVIINNYTPEPTPELPDEPAGPTHGSLVITKQLAGNFQNMVYKVFTFDVYGPEGYTRTVSITGTGSVTLLDLVPGTYTVVERDANCAGYTLNVSGSGSTAEVSIGGVSQVTITNTYEAETPDTPTNPTTPTNPQTPSSPNTPSQPNVVIDENETPLSPAPLTSQLNGSGDTPYTLISDVQPDNLTEITDTALPLGYLPKTGEANVFALIGAVSLISLVSFVLGAKLLKDDK